MSRWTLCLALAIIAAVVLGSACGDDDDGEEAADDTGTEAVNQIGSTAELATYAYASGGAAALYDYVSESVTGVCTREEFAADLAGSDEPTGFRGVEDIEVDGETATATVVQIFDTEDRSVEWAFVDEGGNTWRITSVPDMDECAPS